jgi:hypothetical protein
MILYLKQNYKSETSEIERQLCLFNPQFNITHPNEIIEMNNFTENIKEFNKHFLSKFLISVFFIVVGIDG